VKVKEKGLKINPIPKSSFYGDLTTTSLPLPRQGDGRRAAF